MRLHRRSMIVSRARNELAVALANIWEKHELTSSEVVWICADVTAAHARHPVRDERHPNQPDKRTDEE